MVSLGFVWLTMIAAGVFSMGVVIGGVVVAQWQHREHEKERRQWDARLAESQGCGPILTKKTLDVQAERTPCP